MHLIRYTEKTLNKHQAANVIPLSSAKASLWHAELSLEFGKTTRGTRLLQSHHKGPLYVQKPFYPEGSELAHVYLLHPPGGMVSGDELSINLKIKSNSQALFTTPGAGRVYKARADQSLQHQQVSLRIANQASAEWFPMETIAYPGTFGKLTTRVDMGANAHFSGWEITCLGLPASAQLFNTGMLKQSFEIYRNEQLVFLERLNLDAANPLFQKGTAGLQGRTVSGIFVSGPFSDQDSANAVLEKLGEHSQNGNTEPGSSLLATTQVNNFLVTRYLGDCAQQARLLFIQCWHFIRPVLLGREICIPRIWST